MILVTGATGNAGSQVVRALLERNRDVRVFARDADRARGLFDGAAELAFGNFDDPVSVSRALDGVETVFLSGADDPRRVGWETAAIDAAAAAGVACIVKLSSITAEPGAPVAFWDWHGRVEQHLRKSGVPAVILRSSFFMTNLFAAAGQVAHEGRFFAPAAEARIAMIDPRDVGAAAAAVLTTPGHAGQTYVLTGPEAVTHAQVAAELSAATGREVEFIDVPDAAAKQAMIEAGVADFVAQQIVNIYAQARKGVAEQVTATVESLTGRPARSFATFARDHARLFAPVAQAAGR
jgi:uncharacterized protein YbjT (DUF2867 family)